MAISNATGDALSPVDQADEWNSHSILSKHRRVGQPSLDVPANSRGWGATLLDTAAPGHVRRRGIARIIAQLPDAKLVLFVAAAGFGKTRAMRQCREELQRDGVTTAWVNLNRTHDDFDRFRRLLIGAILQLTGEYDHSPSSDVGATAADVNGLSTFVLDALASLTHPFAIFIDGFDSLRNQAVVAVIQQLVSLLPERGRVCIASRSAPPLELGCLRARAQLIEIDQSALRFSQDETEQFLSGLLGRRMVPDDIKKLHTEAEGWPAILWLAAGTLKYHPDPRAFVAAFSGANAAIAEFLREELLCKQTPALQQFLLKSSILQELNPSVCEAVCGEGSANILKELRHLHEVMTPLGADESRFQLRPLAGSFLRSQLSLLTNVDVPALHIAAARWYSAQGRIVQAVEHALSSGEIEYTVLLLRSCAERLLCQGRSRLLTRWFDALPASALRPCYQLRVAQIWALTTMRRGTDALAKLDELCRDPGELVLSDELKTELRVLRSCILAMVDRAAEGVWLAREELRQLPTRDSMLHRIMVTTLATWKVASNQFADAIIFAQMFQYRDDRSEASSSYYSTFIEGLIALVQCHLRESIAHFRVALNAATPAFKGTVAIHLCEALYEIDELQEVRELLAQYSPAIRRFGRPDELVISHVLQAKVALSEGDTDSAFLRLSELEYIARHEQLPRVLACAQLERARMAMCAGEIAIAKTHLDRACSTEIWRGLRGIMMPANDVETTELARYRLYVSGSDKDDVIAELTAEIKSAQSCHRHRRALRLNLMLAKILHTTGQSRLAMRTLEAALRIAKQDDLVRVFLDEGPPIVDLVRAFRTAKVNVSQSSPDTSVVAFADRILARAGVGPESSTEQPECAAGAPALTARELQTLDALARGLSNLKIAERLFVSETTVRSHLRKISVKLGTTSRTQAVCVARNLGLI